MSGRILTFDGSKGSRSFIMDVDPLLPRMAGFMQAFGIRPCEARLPVKGAVCAGGRAKSCVLVLNFFIKLLHLVASKRTSENGTSASNDAASGLSIVTHYIIVTSSVCIFFL